MKILFIHQNFPGQFKFLAPALVKQGHEVVAMTMPRLSRERPVHLLGIGGRGRSGRSLHVRADVHDFAAQIDDAVAGQNADRIDVRAAKPALELRADAFGHREPRRKVLHRRERFLFAVAEAKQRVKDVIAALKDIGTAPR